MNSLVLFGKDLECQTNFNLVNYTIEVEAKPKVFSCCFPLKETTMATTPYSGPTGEKMKEKNAAKNLNTSLKNYVRILFKMNWQ